MLSYQHGYHAGCFADVIKHVALTRIFDYLCLKEKPLFYLDTHSGRGLYDLKDPKAMKTAESLQGISLLWKERKTAPKIFSSYLQVIHALNPTPTLRYYPGSPTLAITCLRAQDRLVLVERHPREFEALSQLARQQKRVFFKEEDGLQVMQALLPPVERRGLIVIDPSYEIKEDYRQIPKDLKAAHSRFATGTFFLWYPILEPYQHNQFINRLKKLALPNTLRLEFYSAVTGAGMESCGLWIVNPPYTLQDEMKECFSFLLKLFNPGKSHFLIEQV